VSVSDVVGQSAVLSTERHDGDVSSAALISQARQRISVLVHRLVVELLLDGVHNRSLYDQAQTIWFQLELVKGFQRRFILIEEIGKEAGQVDADSIRLDAHQEPLSISLAMNATRDAELVAGEIDMYPVLDRHLLLWSTVPSC
jgi:hypothetical protein